MRHRILSILLAAVIVLTIAAGCSDSEDIGTTSDTTPAATTARMATPPTALPDDGCSSAPPPTWLEEPTFHTIAPAPDPITVTVETADDRVCPGGQVQLRVTFRNRGVEDIRLAGANVIMRSGFAGWHLAAEISDLDVAAGETVTVDSVGTVPPVAPGSYPLGVYGYESDKYTEITVDAPSG